MQGILWRHFSNYIFKTWKQYTVYFIFIISSTENDKEWQIIHNLMQKLKYFVLECGDHYWYQNNIMQIKL